MAVNASPPPYSPNTVNQTVDYGGITWKGQPGGGWVAQSTSSGAPVSSGDPVADAEALSSWAQKQQIAANQPAIQTLQTQYNPSTGTGSLVDRYNTLLDSITQAEQPALNSQTVATENELGRRGLTADSGVSQNQLAQSLLPVTAQFGQLKANTGLSEQQDLAQLAGQIASLQAGNMPTALSFGSGIGQTEQQAQAAIQEALIRNQAPVSLGAGQTLVDPVTGKTISSNNTVPGATTLGGASGASFSGGNTTATPAIKVMAQTNNPTLMSPGALPNLGPTSKIGNSSYVNFFPTGGLNNNLSVQGIGAGMGNPLALR